jgi:FkbM family methyltransferase
MGFNLTFTMMEIGARPIQEEAFYRFLTAFPSSRILAFEVDEKLCEEMNNTNGHQIRYYPYAIGKTTEERPFYITRHPMCSSLYRPNEQIMSMFQNLDVARLERTCFLNTISADQFIAQHHISDPVDFIKIDIQGAELEVFQGAKKLLKDVLMIVCEVEFVPLYHNQPLFGDVAAFLQKHGFVFHKFFGA